MEKINAIPALLAITVLLNLQLQDSVKLELILLPDQLLVLLVMTVIFANSRKWSATHNINSAQQVSTVLQTLQTILNLIRYLVRQVLINR